MTPLRDFDFIFCCIGFAYISDHIFMTTRKVNWNSKPSVCLFHKTDIFSLEIMWARLHWIAECFSSVDINILDLVSQWLLIL